MNSRRFSSSPLPLHLISVLVIAGIPLSLSTPELYRNCSDAEFKCGHISAGYPFSGGERPAECGHPDLKLQCEKYTTVIEILGVRYQVLDIHWERRTLRIAREDFKNDLCSPQIENSILDSMLFKFVNATAYANVTLLYDCPHAQGLLSNDPFICNGAKYKNVSVVPGDTDRGPCSASVMVPIPQTSLTKIGNSTLLLAALKTEFEVEWKVDTQACQKCERSRGACGFMKWDVLNVCYCPNPNKDWQDPTECHPPISPSVSPPSGATQAQAEKKTDVSLITGLGIAGAVIAGILLGMGFLCLRQRRQKLAAQAKSRDLPTPPSSKGPPTSTTSLSQSIPSYPTSNYDLEKGSTYFGAHIFSYEELEEATDNFNPSKELGEGGFGTVYYGVLNDGRVVAVKRLYESNFKRAEQYMNEIEILTRIRHPNLVTLYGCTSRRSRELLLVYEYIPNGTVADHLHGKLSNSGLLTWPVRLSIAVETANALAYLHAAPIIHRDVKTNNILLDKNFHVKVADFGLSRLFPDNVTHVSTAPQGTPGYVDPEYYQCYQLTEKSDVYSFGVVLIELISSKQAVDTNRHRLDINLANMAVSRIQNHALHELVDPSLGFEDDYAVKTRMTGVAELAFRCLQQERDVRPSMEEVLETLRGIRDEELGVQKAEVVDIRSEAEVVDIRSDDVGLLKHIPPPLSPDSINDKWMQVRSM